MWKYILKRVILAIVTIFIIIAITFFTMNAVPGGPFQKEKAPDPAVQKQLEERFHLDKPVWEQFLIYLGNIFQGDFGISLKTGRNISQTIFDSFSISAILGGTSIVVALVLGLFFGCLAAIKRNSWADRVIIFFSTLFVAVPSFVLATILLLVFCLLLAWLPVWTPTPTPVNYILPVIALALYQCLI